MTATLRLKARANGFGLCACLLMVWQVQSLSLTSGEDFALLNQSLTRPPTNQSPSEQPTNGSNGSSTSKVLLGHRRLQVFFDTTYSLDAAAVYLTVIHCMNEAVQDYPYHRGIWDFERRYGIQLSIQPHVLPWYHIQDLTFAFSELALQMTTAQRFSDCRAVLYVDGLAIFEVLVFKWPPFGGAEVQPKTFAAPAVVQRALPVANESVGIVQYYRIYLKAGSALTTGEDLVMLSIIRALRDCIDLEQKNLQTFSYLDPSSNLLTRFFPRTGFDSVPTFAVVEALEEVAIRENGLDPYLKAFQITVQNEGKTIAYGQWGYS